MFRKPFKTPLLFKSPSATDEPPEKKRKIDSNGPKHYSALWRNKTNKKHKTWDGDGTLEVADGFATLKDESGKYMGRAICESSLSSGDLLSIGGKDVEVDGLLAEDPSRPDPPATQDASSHTNPPLKPVFSKPLSLTQPKVQHPNPQKPVKFNVLAKALSAPKPIATDAPTTLKAAYKAPLLDKTIQNRGDGKAPTPRHDPLAEGALVMKRPHAKSIPKGKQVVDVVVDPLISRHLREHQREGVAFLYECVMGLRPFDGEGAILADEMGLGKTLQTIALLWTLLKQSPIHGDKSVIKKALIVCPVSLINNWRREFRKWLGLERIGVMVVNDNKRRITDFTKGKSYNIMIIGYEKLRLVQEDLQKGAGIDIVIADEGHRLKTAKNKSAMAIKSLNTERRVILSGTPLQNDLSEFFTMVDFINPGLLGKYSTFKRDYETPIMRSRQREATANDVEKGQASSEELASITSQFILRRTAEILAKYLPPKTEYVVFCRPTKAQATIYEAILESSSFPAVFKNAQLQLQLINVLKKVCNSPFLLHKDADAKVEGEADAAAPSLIDGVPAKLLKGAKTSGKLATLDSLLHIIHEKTDEKVIVLSNYTNTLDRIEVLLSAFGYPFLRLDGSTQSSKRHDLVETFNRTPARSNFVFLLSTKAGGLGLNLIGASRLVLFDIDWNPAYDIQAMARICRDGQKRPCFIYRLLTKGAIEEKIYQRQVTKQGLADSIVDSKQGTSSFSQSELRDLFTLHHGERCQTHELLGCGCKQDGVLAGDTEVDEDVVVPDEDADPDADLPEVSELLQSKSQFVPASQVSQVPEEQVIEDRQRSSHRNGGGKMDSLMLFAHFNARTARDESLSVDVSDIERVDDARSDKDSDMDEPVDGDAVLAGVEHTDAAVSVLENAIRDPVLRQAILEPNSHIDFVFAKTSAQALPDKSKEEDEK